MDAEERARLRERATYAARAARKMDYRAREVDVWTLADDAIALLDELDAAEARLAEVRQIAFDADVVAAMECGKEAAPSVKRLTLHEAHGYGVDALRDIRATLSDPALGVGDAPSLPPKSPQSSGT